MASKLKLEAAVRRVLSTGLRDAEGAFSTLLISVIPFLLVLRDALEVDASAVLVIIVVVAVFFWMTNILDPTLVGLFVIGSIWLTQSAERALVGFTYPATWLVVFGIVMGEAIQSSGLSSRLEHSLYALVKHVVDFQRAASRARSSASSPDFL